MSERPFSAMNKYIDFFYKAFFKVHYICFFYILLLAIACPYQDIKWAGAISLGIVILIVKKYRTLHVYFNLFWKRIELNSDTFFLKLQIVSLIILFIFSYLLRVNLSWDYGQIITSAYEYARYGEIQNLAYYARYGNNQLILLFFFCYFKVMLFLMPSATLSMCQAATLPINCLIIEAAIQMTYRTAKICMGPKHAFVSGIICLSCSPFYLYSSIAYTDTLGLLFLILILYFYLMFITMNHFHKWWFLFLCFSTGVIGYYFKATIGIVIIAVIFDYVLRSHRKSEKPYKSIIIFLIILLTTALSVNIIITNTLERYTGISQTQYEENKFPLTHWIMMSLNKSGGYNQDDVDFTKSFPTVDMRKEANLTMIRERLHERGIIGTLSNILYTKWRRTWTYSTCAADDYIKRHPVKPNILHAFFTAEGKYYLIYILYAHSWWIILLMLVVKSTFQHINGQDHIFVLHLTVFGLLLFLSFWECNPRYLVLFLPALILIAADGLCSEYY